VTFVDSNVLIDIVGADPVHADWSLNALEAAALAGPVVADPIVFAETSIRFATFEAATRFFERAEIALHPTPQAALFLAGRTFLDYRRKGGARSGVLPDFLIGAHAAVRGAPLLTRDTSRYRTYFPKLNLIAPR
jgi:predicted nucleic acid-binding protein